MTLQTDIPALTERISKLKDIKANVEKSRSLQARKRELQSAVDVLDASNANLKRLKKFNIETGQKGPSFVDAIRRAETIRQRFLDDPEPSALVYRRTWERLLEDLHTIADAVTAQAVASWQDHVRNQYSGERPQDLERSLARTDDNIKALLQYKAAYLDYSRISGSMPESPEDIARLTQVAARLQTISQSFQRDVPDDVKRFLDAVAAEGATMDLLSDSVLRWLREQGHVERFRVIARR